MLKTYSAIVLPHAHEPQAVVFFLGDSVRRRRDTPRLRFIERILLDQRLNLLMVQHFYPLNRRAFRRILLFFIDHVDLFNLISNRIPEHRLPPLRLELATLESRSATNGRALQLLALLRCSEQYFPVHFAILVKKVVLLLLFIVLFHFRYN